MYTSYFSRCSLNPNAVSIARFKPVWYFGKEFPPLFPRGDLVKLAKVDWVKFKELYREEILDTLCQHEIAEELGEQAILICYEANRNVCHRSIVAEWFAEAGFTVPEMVFPPKVKYKHDVKPGQKKLDCF